MVIGCDALARCAVLTTPGLPIIELESSSSMLNGRERDVYSARVGVRGRSDGSSSVSNEESGV